MFEFFFYGFKIYISGVVEGVSRGKVLLMVVRGTLEMMRKSTQLKEKKKGWKILC